MHRCGLHSYIQSFGSQFTLVSVVLESRMREIRLSGLVGGLLMQDVLFMNAKGDLP